ncbi:MAG TPA: cytoplasmic protein [Firmicutes bacterium]|nr:cytoplasmic protein [Bacillota bacterium]
MVKVLYVGDSAGVVGPLFVASPFEVEVKGFNVHVWGQPLIDGLQAEGDIKVTHMPSWQAYGEYPKTPEEMANYDVVIVSDVERDVLILYPVWTKAPMGPNRLMTTKEYVENGGSFLMVGGWTSFTGRFARAGYGDTPIGEILPVECLPVTDDRAECPEGAKVEILNGDHPILKGIAPESWPLFLGYNKTRLKPGAELLATINGDPLIAVWEYGKGRVMAFTTDCSPHWGVEFVRWEHYGKFWRQAIRWLARA